MDAEKRHQLKTNELAEALGKLRDFGSDPQIKYWIAAIAVIIVAFAGYRMWTRMQTQQLTSGWQELAAAGATLQGESDVAIAEIQQVVDSASEPALDAAARIRLAAALRKEAQESPEEHDQLMQRAVNALQPIASVGKAPDPLAAAALYALATAYESLGQFDEAKSAYQQIVDASRFAGTTFPDRAQERLDTLDELRQSIPMEPGMPPEPEPMTPAQGPVGPSAPPMQFTPPPAEAPAEPATDEGESPTTQPTEPTGTNSP